MTASRFLPADPADFLRSVVPLALLAAAAAFPALRIAILVVLGAGTLVAIGRNAPVRWTWAAAVPVAVSLAWGTWPAPLGAADGSDCATPLSNVALWRVGEAVVVLGVLLALALTMRASSGSLSLRMPAARYVRYAVLGFLVAGPLALLVGPLLARPFFGDVGYDVTRLGAIVPALLFAGANGVMEETIYRGALLAGRPGSWASGRRSSARRSCSVSPTRAPTLQGRPSR